MSHLTQRARAMLVGDRPNDWQTYHAFIAKQLAPGMRVLDVGCGAGTIAPFPWKDYPGIELIGLDPDPAARKNPNLHRFELLTDAARWPIEDSSIDLVVARYVLEHVEKPTEFFKNLTRVLRPGGRFVTLTPNRFHPAIVASSLLPLRIKQRILKASRGIDDTDVFETWYRLNTVGQLRRQALKYSFDVEHLNVREYVPIGYLDFNVLGFLLSYAYYRTVRCLRVERWLGVSIIAVFKKP